MKSSQITHFFDVMKKEIKDEDEEILPDTYDHTNVKQEYHYKEELDLAWDEDGKELENKENIYPAWNNSSRKLDYPIVLVERLSYNAANNPFSIHQRENTSKSLSVQRDNRKKLLQHYRKICPKCNEIGSSIKPTANCKYCNEQWIYECKKCAKQSRSYNSIICHLKSKCFEKRCYFACFKCDYKSVSKFSVNEHLKSVHSIFYSLNRIDQFKSDTVQKDTAAKLHKCTKCRYEFDKLPSLLRHMQVCGQTESITSFNNFAATSNVLKGRCAHYCLKCKKTVKDDNVGNFRVKKCEICDTKFSFKCKKCSKIFHSYTGVNDHLKSSHPVTKDAFKCHQCDYKTPSMRYLTSHVARRHYVEIPKFQCNTCSYRSKTKQHLKRHIEEVHVGGNEIECPQCNITLKSKTCLQVHLGYCKKQPRHQCDKCSFMTKYKTNLTRHYEYVHSKILTKNEQCPRCAKKFKNKYCVRQHLQYCGKKGDFSCKYCSGFFKSKHYLKAHLLRIHSKNHDVENDSTYKVAYFYCDNCTFKSKFKWNLVKHVSIHLDDYRKECSVCKKYFSQGYLKKHEKYCGKYLRCNLCNHRASNEDCMSKHIANMHSEGNEIDCSRCGKTFKNKRYMSKHLRFCDTDAHLQCDFCSYKTKYKHHLKRHIENVHLKSKKSRLE